MNVRAHSWSHWTLNIKNQRRPSSCLFSRHKERKWGGLLHMQASSVSAQGFWERPKWFWSSLSLRRIWWEKIRWDKITRIHRACLDSPPFPVFCGVHHPGWIIIVNSLFHKLVVPFSSHKSFIQKEKQLEGKSVVPLALLTVLHIYLKHGFLNLFGLACGTGNPKWEKIGLITMISLLAWTSFWLATPITNAADHIIKVRPSFIIPLGTC